MRASLCGRGERPVLAAPAGASGTYSTATAAPGGPTEPWGFPTRTGGGRTAPSARPRRQNLHMQKAGDHAGLGLGQSIPRDVVIRRGGPRDLRLADERCPVRGDAGARPGRLLLYRAPVWARDPKSHVHREAMSTASIRRFPSTRRLEGLRPGRGHPLSERSERAQPRDWSPQADPGGYARSSPPRMRQSPLRAAALPVLTGRPFPRTRPAATSRPRESWPGLRDCGAGSFEGIGSHPYAHPGLLRGQDVDAARRPAGGPRSVRRWRHPPVDHRGGSHRAQRRCAARTKRGSPAELYRSIEGRCPLLRHPPPRPTSAPTTGLVRRAQSGPRPRSPAIASFGAAIGTACPETEPPETPISPAPPGRPLRPRPRRATQAQWPVTRRPAREARDARRHGRQRSPHGTPGNDVIVGPRERQVSPASPPTI